MFPHHWPPGTPAAFLSEKIMSKVRDGSSQPAESADLNTESLVDEVMAIRGESPAGKKAGVEGPIRDQVREVIDQLRANGMSAKGVRGSALMIVTLLLKYGPDIVRIVQEILEAWTGGE